MLYLEQIKETCDLLCRILTSDRDYIDFSYKIYESTTHVQFNMKFKGLKFCLHRTFTVQQVFNETLNTLLQSIRNVIDYDKDIVLDQLFDNFYNSEYDI